MPNVSQEVQYQFRTRVARGTPVARCFRGRTPGHRRALPQAAKWPRTDVDEILNSVDTTSRQGQWRWDGSIRVCFSIRSILINEIISEYLPALIGSFRRKSLEAGRHRTRRIGVNWPPLPGFVAREPVRSGKGGPARSGKWGDYLGGRAVNGGRSPSHVPCGGPVGKAPAGL